LNERKTATWTRISRINADESDQPIKLFACRQKSALIREIRV